METDVSVPKNINQCAAGVDYNNECVARCDGIMNALLCSNGRCDQQEEVCACTKEYTPYCCEDKTYSNECAAECQRGSCESECTVNVHYILILFVVVNMADNLIINALQLVPGLKRVPVNLYVPIYIYYPYCCDEVTYATSW